VSGIFGIVHFDDRPVQPHDMVAMAATLKRRGPDGSGMWHDGPAGLGHTMLATTPESLHEQPPILNRRKNLVITADARLDNRDELIDSLGLRHQPAGEIGDNALILGAYEKWGEACSTKLLGDFAFAIWDGRSRCLFCARDPFGVRPFYYHHSVGGFFAFASEPRAILMLPQTPYRINEGRIADFLISQLEGIDKTSTFFEELYRLPPAHTLTVTPRGIRRRRYWTLAPGPEIRLSSDEEYAEAFLEILTEAVRCRLRGAGPVGSMLSGGMDSGSIVAVARALLADVGQGPLPTFSAVASGDEHCVETRTIHAAQTMAGLDPHVVDSGRLDDLLPELENLSWSLDEPFDTHITLVRAMDLAARRHGVKVLLDGIDGDTVLSEGTHLTRLLRRGRWLTVWRESVGQNRFWGGDYPPWRQMSYRARQAFVPEPVRRWRQALRARNHQAEVQRIIRESMIDPAFAQRIRLGDRLQALDAHSPPGLTPSLAQERARAVDHPYLTVGLERYNRAASALALEPRHPFLDRRLVAFSIALPGEQKLAQGWQKMILRRAMAGQLPEAVRWRWGKEHLGWVFTAALMKSMQANVEWIIHEHGDTLSSYLDMNRMPCATAGDPEQESRLFDVAHLAVWLDRHAARPRPED